MNFTFFAGFTFKSEGIDSCGKKIGPSLLFIKCYVRNSVNKFDFVYPSEPQLPKYMPAESFS